MLASLQLAINSKGVLFLTSNQLSNSKQIEEVCDNLIMMRNVYSEEIDPSNKTYFCNPYRMEKVGEEWVANTYQPDDSKVWRMLFYTKTRSGSNSEDTGTA